MIGLYPTLRRCKNQWAAASKRFRHSSPDATMQKVEAPMKTALSRRSYHRLLHPLTKAIQQDFNKIIVDR